MTAIKTSKECEGEAMSVEKGNAVRLGGWKAVTARSASRQTRRRCEREGQRRAGRVEVSTA